MGAMAMGKIGGKVFGDIMTFDDRSELKKTLNTRYQGLNAGGLTVSGGKGPTTVTSSAERTGLVRGLSEAFGGQAGQIRSDLLPQVAPGFGRLTESAVNALNAKSSKAIGNLRESLAKRRVLGSSFAQDTLARAEREFAESEAQLRAQSFLQELDMTSQLMDRAYQADVNKFQTSLNELNLQAELGANISKTASQIMLDMQKLKAATLEKSIEGEAKFWGEIGSDIGGMGAAA